MGQRRVLWACLVAAALWVSGCQKKSDGESGGGGGESPKTTDPGTIEIDVAPEGEQGGEADPAPELPPPDDGANLVTESSMSPKIPLRPAQAVGTLAVSLTTPTELASFEENKYVWNPAQIPLEELNKLVCVLANSGFHLHGNKGKYIAKMKLGDCFSQQGPGAGHEQSAPDLPTDVLVDAQTEDNDDIKLKVWFTRVIENGAYTTDVFVWGHFEKLELDYYVEATIEETPSNDNPFGVFDMKWEMLLRKDGELDPNPYQQGYVATEKLGDKINLRYNQKNWDYESQSCPTQARGHYQGAYFNHSNNGAAHNGTALNFDGVKTVGQVITDAGGSVTASLTDDTVMPAGSVTLAGGQEPVFASQTYDTILFNSAILHSATINVNAGDTVNDILMNYSHHGLHVDPAVDLNQVLTIGSFVLGGFTLGQQASALHQGATFSVPGESPAANGLQINFDGIQTIEQVFADFSTAHGFGLQHDGYADQVVFPAGSVTLGGGIDVTAASAVVNTNLGPITISSDTMNGGELNGFRIYFDGTETAQDGINKIILPYMGASLSVTAGDSMSIPVEGYVTLSGGSGAQKDIYANAREFAAIAEMDLLSGKPRKGQAHTAENWSRDNTTNHCPGTVLAWNPEPVSYGMAFDRYDTYPNHQEPSDPNLRVDYPGRAATKQFSDFVDAGAAAGFDASALRCEQMGGELADVWEWAIFDANGKRIEHKTNFPLFLEHSSSPWGDGWVSEWGISVWANVAEGDRAYIKNSDGSKRMFDIVKFNGVLRDESWSPAHNAKATGTDRFTCQDFCPAGVVTQNMLDNRFDPSYFLYDQEYVFDYVTKELYRDYDKDGDKDELVVLDSGVDGSFELTLTLKNDTPVYRYELSSWNVEIGLKEGSTFFVPPSRILFNTSQQYHSEDAYPGTETINAAHNGKPFSDLISGDTLAFEYGSICCFDHEQKTGIKDQWGNDAWGSKVTLRKGAELTVDASALDPDGPGPIHDGMRIKIAPAFTELRPLSKNDCSAGLESTLDAIESSMALPAPLPNASDREISEKIGSRPAGSFPVLVVDGESSS